MTPINPSDKNVGAVTVAVNKKFRNKTYHRKIILKIKIIYLSHLLPQIWGGCSVLAIEIAVVLKHFIKTHII